MRRRRNAGSVTLPDPDPVVATIAEIQGTGAATPARRAAGHHDRRRHRVLPDRGSTAFYVQTAGSGGTAKAAGEASDGIFVYTVAAPTATIGDCYTITGIPAEFNGLTQLTKPVLTSAADCAPVKANRSRRATGDGRRQEAYEGMLVEPAGT